MVLWFFVHHWQEIFKTQQVSCYLINPDLLLKLSDPKSHSHHLTNWSLQWMMTCRCGARNLQCHVWKWCLV